MSAAIEIKTLKITIEELQGIMREVGGILQDSRQVAAELTDRVERIEKSADTANNALDWIRKAALNLSLPEAVLRSEILTILATAAESLTGDPTLTTTEDKERAA